MDAADFARVGGHPHSFHWWKWNHTVPSSLGPFDVELRTGGNCPPPDRPILDAASALASALQRLEARVIDIVVGHYRWHQVEAPDWLTQEGVPLDLDRNGLGKFLRDRA